MVVFFFVLVFYFMFIVGKDLIDFFGYFDCDGFIVIIKNCNVIYGFFLCSVIQVEKNVMGEMFVIRIRGSVYVVYIVGIGCRGVFYYNQNSFVGVQFDYLY